MNASLSKPLITYTIEEYYPSAAISSCFALLSIIINSITIFLVWRNKQRLHTVNHLLICNTAMATILYSVVTINNYIYLLFVEWETSDMSCRWRAYFLFVGISGIFYSYMIQALSRLFFSVISFKYRSLRSFQTHYILLIIEWLVVLTLTSPTLITDNVRFYPATLCWISSQYTLHIFYAFTAYYVLPVVIITIIYIRIYCHVRRTKRNRTILMSFYNSQKRDLEILRNIIVVISIFLVGGFPSVLASIVSGKILYLLSLTTQPLTALLATIGLMVLDRELRKVVKNIRCRTVRVTPVVNIMNFV